MMNPQLTGAATHSGPIMQAQQPPQQGPGGLQGPPPPHLIAQSRMPPHQLGPHGMPIQQQQQVQQQQQIHQGPPGHLGPHARLNELFEAIQHEFDSVAHDTSFFKIQNTEFEHKLASQIQEMTQIQHNVLELERAHQKVKQQYEDEILRLRRELEKHGIPVPQPQFISPVSSSGTAGEASGGASGVSQYHQQMAMQLNNQTRSQEPSPPPSINSNGAVTPIHRQKSMVFGDVEVEALPPSFRQDTPDFHAYYNPKVERQLAVGLMHTIEHSSVVCCVRFSANGRYMASGSNKSTQLFDAATGELVATFKDDLYDDGDLYVRALGFCPDSLSLATGAEDRLIRIWDIESGKVKHRLQGHGLDIYSLEYSRDGKYIVSGSGDRTVRVWDSESGECIHILSCTDSSIDSSGDDESSDNDEFRDAGVTSVSISPDGRYVAAGSLDRSVRLWQLDSGEYIGRMDGHADSVYSVAFSPDSKSIASSSLDKSVRHWSVDRLECTQTLLGHKDFALSVAFSPDGKYIISGSKDRSVQVWDAETGQSQLILNGHKNSVISIGLDLSDISSDEVEEEGQGPALFRFATGSGDCKARLWQLRAL